MSDSKARNLFISYAREDIETAKALYSHLKPLILSGRLNVFFDTESIEKGGSWEDKIDNHLSEADAFIFLTSRHFFDSEFVIDKELPGMIRRYRDERIKCWPFLIAHYPWEDFEFEGIRLSSIQAIGPFDAQENLVPLNSLGDYERDLQFSRVYNEIRNWVDREMQSQQAPPPISAGMESGGGQNLPGNYQKPLDRSEDETVPPAPKERPSTVSPNQGVQTSASAGARSRNTHESAPARPWRWVAGAMVLVAVMLGGYLVIQSLTVRSSQAEQHEQDVMEQELKSLLARMRDAIRNERFEEAEQLLARMEQLRPDSSRLAGMRAQLEDAWNEYNANREQSRQIDEMLLRAEKYARAKQYIAPPGENALEMIQRVRELDPGNTTAEQLREGLVSRFIARATGAIGVQDFDEAERNLEIAARIGGETAVYQRTREYLTRAREEARAEEERKVKIIERAEPPSPTGLIMTR